MTCVHQVLLVKNFNIVEKEYNDPIKWRWKQDWDMNEII